MLASQITGAPPPLPARGPAAGHLAQRQAASDRPGSAIPMSWRACFVDGPLAAPEHDRRFATARVHHRVWLAQIPDEDGRIGSDVWSLVGSLPGSGPPIEPWPGQVEYVLDPALSDLDPPAGDRFVVFRLVG